MKDKYDTSSLKIKEEIASTKKNLTTLTEKFEELGRLIGKGDKR